MIRSAPVFCLVVLTASSVFAQGEFEAETHWHVDLSKNLFEAGGFSEVDVNKRPSGWDELRAFESGNAVMLSGAGLLRLRADNANGGASIATTIVLPDATDYLTFYVRMRGPQIIRGESAEAGGGVVFSFVNVFGDHRTFPRLDPSYQGYRNWNEFIATARVQTGESKLNIRIQVVDAKGALEIDQILVVPSTPGFHPTAEQMLVLQQTLKNDDGGAIANLIKEERRMLELRTGERDNCTLLGLAVWKDAANVARELIKAGADLEAVDYNWGNTPLGWACIQGRKEVAVVLVEGGANIDGYAAMAQASKHSGTWPNRSPEDYDAIVKAIHQRQKREENSEQARCD